ncbi:MAG: alpha,alpha-trehalose-phosphate synthase (UDP-forming) [Acidimicrobiales bacterium]
MAADPMKRERSEQEDTVTAGSLVDTIIVSNRGPLSFRLENGNPVASPVGGGLAGSLHPLLAGTGATWVACALDEADRAAAAAGLMTEEGLRLELIDPDPDVYNLAYNVVSNATLWFCHHHLFDAARRPRNDRRWLEAWDGYRQLNSEFAARVAKVAPVGARVLVQDYHLSLLGNELAQMRPDLRTVHFTHTPFADPSVLRMLPTEVATELLTSMASFGTCGFHTSRWAAAYRANQEELGPKVAAGLGVHTFVSPLSSDAVALERAASDPEVGRHLAELKAQIGDDDRQVIVRVDRLELSKNLLRGFWAFDELLETEPRRRGSVVLVALAYPTRQNLADYLAYQNEVATVVERINERWRTATWTPIILDMNDDYAQSLAAMACYDVLLVNPIRDGLNLVAKEGPLVNDRDGVLVLSREAGAFEELGSAALEVNPFDVSGTAAVLARALDLSATERAARSVALRRAILSRRPEDWLSDQLHAAR